MVKDISHNQAVVLAHFHGVADCFDDPLDAALPFEVAALLYEVLSFEEVNDNIIEIEHGKLKPVRSL